MKMSEVPLANIRIEQKGAIAAAKSIRTGLRAYNAPHLGKRGSDKKLVLTARGEADAITGGLVGTFSFDWLYIHLLWVDEAHRGEDIGTSLLGIAEAEALRRGANHIRLETWSFQAPGFYAKLGFTEFGRLDDHPKGFTTHFLVKRLP